MLNSEEKYNFEFPEDMILIPLKKVSYEALREVIDKDAQEIYENN